MFIILNWQDYAEPAGYVADLCECCGALRCCELWELKQDAGAYGLTTHRWTRGFRIRCGKCGYMADVPRDRYDGTLREIRRVDVLVAETHAEAPRKYAERLRLEERARSGEAAPDERVRLVGETLAGISRDVGKEAESPFFEPRDPLFWPIVLAAATSVLSLLFAMGAYFESGRRYSTVGWRTVAASGALGVAAAAACALLVRGHRWRIARQTGALGWVARALARLEATGDEIRRAFAGLPSDAWIARHVGPKDVQRELERFLRKRATAARRDEDERSGAI